MDGSVRPGLGVRVHRVKGSRTCVQIVSQGPASCAVCVYVCV